MGKKFTWENLDADRLSDLTEEVYAFLEKRCKKDEGSLPVSFNIRSKKLHYPFNDLFLISRDDKDIDQAIELQMSNLEESMSKLNMLIRIKKLLKTKS